MMNALIHFSWDNNTIIIGKIESIYFHLPPVDEDINGMFLKKARKKLKPLASVIGNKCRC